MSSNGTRIVALGRWVVPPIVSAVLLVLAFPPFNWPLFAWVALVPLLIKLYRSRVLSGFCAGLFCGMAFYLMLMGWTAELFTAHTWQFWALDVVFGFFFGLFAGVSCWLLRSLPSWAPLIFPTTWAAIEFLRCNIGFASQPFGILAYSQYTLLPVAGIAAYSGIFGVSFLVVAGNAVLVRLLQVKPYFASRNPGALSHGISAPSIPLLAMIALLLGWFSFHAIASDGPPSANRLTVAVVQGNALADEEYGYERYVEEVLPVYERLTLESSGADLVVWPSTSVPGILPGDRRMASRLGSLARKADTSLLIGSAGADKFNPDPNIQQRIANSAFLFSPTGRLQGRYDKMKLLPFDEYIPARDVIPWPDWIISSQMTDRSPGKELTIFHSGPVRFGVQICFENMFPEQIRTLALRGVDFVVGQTNEAYTDSLAGHYQNLVYYVFRAIENRLPVIRSATTGISCIIDATGRIIASVQDASGSEVNVAGVATAQIALGGERSFYTRHGDLFAYVCIAVVTFLIAIAIFIRFRRALMPNH